MSGNNTRLRIASGLLYVVSFASIAVGLVYCLSPTIMPYHERFLATKLDRLDPQVVALLFFMMRGAGAIFIALGLGIAVLVRGLFSKGDPCSRLAIGIMTLLSLVPLLAITLSIGVYTPWWAVALMIVLVISALFLSRLPRALDSAARFDDFAPSHRGTPTDSSRTRSGVRAEIRQATFEDLPAVLSLYAQPDMDDGALLTLEQARKIYATMGLYPDYRLYIALLDKQVVGTFSVLIADNLAHVGAKSGLVEDVIVRTDLQRLGLGRQMMEFAQNVCREKGCYKMALSSNVKRKGAHAFYESLGFRRRGYSFLVDL